MYLTFELIETNNGSAVVCFSDEVPVAQRLTFERLLMEQLDLSDAVTFNWVDADRCLYHDPETFSEYVFRVTKDLNEFERLEMLDDIIRETRSEVAPEQIAIVKSYADLLRMPVMGRA